VWAVYWESGEGDVWTYFWRHYWVDLWDTMYVYVKAYYAYTAKKYYYNSVIVTPESYQYTPAIETNPIHYTYTEV